VTQPRPLIAVVDDEEPIRKAMDRLLRSASLDVVTFASGAAFLESLEAQEPDCVVLDLHMPCLSGFDVQAQLTTSAPRLPIVVITGHDSPGARERVIEAGAAGYLRKPVDGQALLDTIASAIAGGKRPRNEQRAP